MADTATPTAPAATPAPTAAPAPAAPAQVADTPAAPTPTPAEPTTARDARASLSRRTDRFPATVAEAKEAATHHSATQPRAETGQFTAPAATPDSSAATAAPDSTASAEATPPATSPEPGAVTPPAEPAAPTTQATPAVPEGMVRIDIPEGHPLRHRGEFRHVPTADAEFFRWAINNPVRRNEVESAADNARQWQQYAAQLKAELEVTREFAGGVFSDPAIIQQAQDIGQTYGEEAKQRFLAGLWQEQQGRVAELTEQQAAEQTATETKATADRFIEQAFAAARTRYPEWSNNDIATALSAFGSWIDARGVTEAKLEDFLRHSDPEYLKLPAVRQKAERMLAARREQEGAAARKAEADRLAAEERTKLEQAAAARSQYPFMRVPAGAVPARVGADTGPVGPTTVHEARRALHRRRA